MEIGITDGEPLGSYADFSLPFRPIKIIALIFLYDRAHAQMISSREAECVLARTELPGDGIRFDVTITHIERPDCIFIQRVPPTDVDRGFSDDPDPTLEGAAEELRILEEIMAKINKPDYFKKYTPLTTASEGKRRLPFWVGM